MKISTFNYLVKRKEPTGGELLELERWKPVLDELDREMNNNNRQHAEKRADMDIAVVDRNEKKEEIVYVTAADLLKLVGDSGDWLEYIYSQRYEDLQELICDEDISEALKHLTNLQKETLYMYEVMQYGTWDIVNIKGTSEINIRKHREAAIKNINKATNCSPAVQAV